MSIKVAVMELVGWHAWLEGSDRRFGGRWRREGEAFPELPVKARVPEDLYMSPSSASVSAPPHTLANLLKCQRDKTR